MTGAIVGDIVGSPPAFFRRRSLGRAPKAIRPYTADGIIQMSAILYFLK